jgi:hypothetical protein
VLILLFLLASAAYPFIDHYGEDSTEGRLVNTVVNGAWYLGSVALIYLIVSRRGASWRDLGLRRPQRRESWMRVIGAIGLFLLCAYIAVLVYGVLIDALGLDSLEPEQQIEDEVYESDFVVIATGALVVFGAPFAEELLFRGFLFAKLRMHLPFIFAAAFSGGFFSLAHLDPGLILPFTAVGMLLAFIYERTGTLWASIGVHFCFNLITFIVLVFVPEAR